MKGVTFLQWPQLDIARCLLTYINSHISAHGTPALCTFSEVCSWMPGLAWLIILMLWAGVGWLPVYGRGVARRHAAWILLPSQLSLTEVAKVETVAKPGLGALWSRWFSLLVTSYSGSHPFLGHLPFFCPFCFPSWTSSLLHTHPVVPSDPIWGQLTAVWTSGAFSSSLFLESLSTHPCFPSLAPHLCESAVVVFLLSIGSQAWQCML